MGDNNNNKNDNNEKINIFTLNGNMQGLLGVAPLSVTQIFSAACSSTPENKKNNIRKIEMFENFKKKNNMSSSSSPFIKIETIEFLKKKDQYLFALVFVREKNIRELQIWQILNKLDSF